MKKSEPKRRTVWISEDMWQKIADAAARDERNRSSWIRWAILTALSL